MVSTLNHSDRSEWSHLQWLNPSTSPSWFNPNFMILQDLHPMILQDLHPMILQDLQPTGTLTDHIWYPILSHSIIIIWLLSQYIPSFLDRANQSSMVDMPFYPKFYDHNLTYNIPIYPNISISICMCMYLDIYIYISIYIYIYLIPDWLIQGFPTGSLGSSH